ncbi:MAG: restriction endonuclease subunit S, partial [Anaerobutyricum hallii]|uniref:restriction endonuclease subunit S n=1 Tax=Anaerobutyricum hallii TaxID=39488 RepID=UPI002430FFBA
MPQDEKFENGGTMRDADKRMYYIVSPQSFAYNPARINVGSIGYQNTSKNVMVSSLYEIFKTTEEVDDRFLWHWFKSDDFQKLIVQLQEGGVRLYFYYDKLCMGSIALPNLAEQQRIGAYLDKLDNLITLHQREIKELKKIEREENYIMKFDKEADFEEAVITALQKNGWEDEVIRYPTEKDLIQNWANILFENNRGIDRLNGQPLIEDEM